LAFAAEALDEKAGDLAVNSGRIYSKTDPDKGVSFADMYKYGVQLHGGDSIIGKGYCKAVPDAQFWGGIVKGTTAVSSGGGRFTDAYGFATALAEVEVNKQTGRVNVLKLTVADDCGFDINPLSVEGQLESQAVMAIGDVLFEEAINREGRVITPTLSDYKIPGSLDIPPIETISVQSNEPKGPYGAKEVGETARGAVIAAIANAVCNAIGAQIYSLPMVPEKVLDAVKEKGSKA
jgi:4-hydroxybenzoyl-CoA reductase subunit alpha